MKKNLLGNNVGLILLIFFVDQLAKFLLIRFVDRLEIISSFVNLSLATSLNTQFAFSLPASPSLIAIVVVAVFFVVVFLWRQLLLAGSTQSYWLALILGGALGNIYDRIYRGGVLDWIEFSGASFHWSSFNLADVAIVVGALGWIFFTSRSGRSSVKVEPPMNQTTNELT